MKVVSFWTIINMLIFKSLINYVHINYEQAERESLKRQLEYINRELTAAASEQNKLKNEMHELEKKNTILKGHAEEMSHRSKVSLSDLKMEMLKQRGEIEKERDKLGNEVEGN